LHRKYQADAIWVRLEDRCDPSLVVYAVECVVKLLKEMEGTHGQWKLGDLQVSG
jgi:hypothetical protein